MITLIIALSLMNGCIADSTNETNFSVLALQAEDLPANYEIVLPFMEYAGNTSCTGEFCPITRGNVWIEWDTADENRSAVQVIGVYSETIAEDVLLQALNDTYPEISTWVIEELEDPEIGEGSIAYQYSAPDDPETDLVPVKGHIIAFGIGNVYEIFVSIGEDYASLKDVSEIAAGKLQAASMENGHVRKISQHIRGGCDDVCMYQWRERRAAEEERINRIQCIGYESCSGAW